MFLKSSSNSLCNYNKTKHNKLCAYCMDCAAQVHVYNLLGGANVNHMETTRQEIGTEKQWYRVTGFMMASWHRNTFCIAGTLWRKPLVTNGFISQRPVKRNFDVLCVVNMNKAYYGCLLSFSETCFHSRTDLSHTVFVVTILDPNRSCVIFTYILQGCFAGAGTIIILPRYLWSNPGPWFNIKMSSYQYGKSHCGDKTVVRSSYLHNGISYTDKMTSLYWISPQKYTDKIPNSEKHNTAHCYCLHCQCYCFQAFKITPSDFGTVNVPRE